MTPERERDLLKEAQDRLAKAIDEDKDNRDEARADLEFIAVPGSQWPEDIKSQRASSGRPCLEINKTPVFVDQVVGDQRMNRPAIKVIPVDSNADVKVAKLLGGWIKHVQQISASDVAIDHGFEHAVACGYGAMRVVTKYVSDTSFEQDAFIEKIDNALAVYWGPHSKYDCSDAKYCFVVTEMDRDEFKEKYKTEPMDFNTASAEYVEGWASKNKVRVAEYFVKEYKTEQLLLLTDGRVVKEKQEGDVVENKRTVEACTIKWYLLTGNKVLDENTWVGKKYIPVIPIWGKEFNVAGKRYIRGLVRFAKDSQRMYNYWTPLALNTLVPTPVGWTTMGNIKVGDKVFDEKGYVCSVTGLSPVFENRKCFEILFDDNTVITADAKHLWTVEERGKRTSATYKWEVKTITTEELIPDKHFVYTQEALKLQEASLPIHPYVLGVWLGDGHTSSVVITQNPQDWGEMVHYLEDCGCSFGKWQNGGVCVNTTLTRLRSKFISMDLLGNKHIPYEYVRGSVEQRLNLLQGLMDTDGSVNSANGACDFTTTNYEIAKGFSELLRTLGIKAKFVIRDRSSKNKWYSAIQSKLPVYQFSFTTRLPVFKLSRKLAGLNKSSEEWRRTKRYSIKAVTPVESVPVRCLSVDSESSLFLVSAGMIPTHNSVNTEVIALQPRVPYMVTPKQLDGHEAQWREAHKQNYPYLLVNFDEKAPGWPKREAPPQASSAMIQAIQLADQELRDTMGLQKAALGMQSNERSGAAIRERKKEGDTGTFAFIDNLSRSVEHLGRVLVDMAPGLLDTERIVRLGLDDGSQEFDAVNIKTEDGRILNDLNAGTYDVVVTVGPSFTTQRTEARESMQQFIQYYPAAAPLIGDLYAKNMDWPGADEAAERLTYLLPPEIRAAKAAKEAQRAGVELPPPSSAPAQPPNPVDVLKVEEEKIKLEEAKVKLQQEIAKLEQLKVQTELMVGQSKENLKKLVDEIVGEEVERQGETTAERPATALM